MADVWRALPLALLVVAAQPGPCGGADGRGRDRTPVNAAGGEARPPAALADTSSLIVRSPLIVLVSVRRVQAGAWTREGREQHRTVSLDLTLERLLKGTLREGAGGAVHVTAVQHEPVGRDFAVPGVWSRQTLTPGARFLVFSRSSSAATAAALSESATEKVLPADDALADTELALAAERDRAPLAALLDRAAPRIGSLGPLFAEYVGARLPGVLFADPAGFAQLLAFLENPALAPAVRGMVLRDLYGRMILADPAPPAFTNQLVVSSFHLLAEPQAAALHVELAGTLLPNLLGIVGGATKKHAADIFRDAPADRAAAERTVAAYADRSAAEPLARWLRG